MLKEAHERDTPFYFDKDNEDCAGKMPLGMMDALPALESGQFGPELGIYQEARGNARIYEHMPVLAKGTVNMEWNLPGYNKEKYLAEMDRLGKKFKLGL